MRRRVRKFIGAAVMLTFVAVYAACAMVSAEARPVREIFYAVVGLAWILPLMPLIAWMERPDAGA